MFTPLFSPSTLQAAFDSRNERELSSPRTPAPSWRQWLSRLLGDTASDAVQMVGRRAHAGGGLKGVLVTNATPLVVQWSHELNQAVALDVTVTQGRGNVRLQLEAGYLECLGLEQVFGAERDNATVEAPQFQQEHLLAVVLDELTQEPVAYSTFTLTWELATQGRPSARLTAGIEQVWTRAAWRGRGASRLLAQAVGQAVQRSVARLVRRMPGTEVCVDIFGMSTAGAFRAFADRCRGAVQEALDTHGRVTPGDGAVPVSVQIPKWSVELRSILQQT